MKQVILSLLLCLLPIVGASAEPEPPRRFALLVGAQEYPNHRLKTVTSDVQEMATTLRKAGWDVEEPVLDPSSELVATRLSAFVGKLIAHPGAEVFVYLSGHGVERDGEANLRLIATPRARARGEEGGLLPVSTVLDGLHWAGASASVIVFDACRERGAPAKERPLVWPSGPRTSRPPSQHLILHATAAGSRAQDGVVSGGRFTRELIAALQPKDTTVQQAFERARQRVWYGTKGDQRPEMRLSAGPIVFERRAPVVLADAALAEKGDTKAIDTARRLLGPSARRDSWDVDDGATEENIEQTLELLFPPQPESRDKLEALGLNGSPGALLVLGVANLLGHYGIVHKDRGRAIIANLQRGGIEDRLLNLERRGSPAASTALALLHLALERDNPEERLRRVRLAAGSDFLPAHRLHLLWTIQVERSRVGAAASERVLRALAAQGEKPAQWVLAEARMFELLQRMDETEPVGRAAIRAELVDLMAPYRVIGIPSAFEMSLRALLDPKLGPSDFRAADVLCEAAWRGERSSSIALCATTWTGREAPRKDEVKALAWMKKAASLGNDLAANQVGLWLKSGYAGAPRDLEAAFKLFDACAERGSTQCMVNAASAKRTGEGTNRDVSRARDLYRRAALLGNNWADARLADMLMNEPELQADPDEVKRHLMAGIEHEDGEAWHILGNAIMNGAIGLKRSEAAAFAAYAQGAKAGSMAAFARFSQARMMGSDQEEFVSGKASLELMAEEGEPQAMHVLAHMLRHGIALPRDEKRAYVLYERLLAKREPTAAATLGLYHELGLADVPVDLAKARTLYRTAADAGVIDGMIRLSSLDVEHGSTPAARQRGFAELLAQAKKGHPAALLAVSQLMLDGRGEFRDIPSGLAHLERAAEAGAQFAQNDMGRRLRHGDGMPLDLVAARRWYMRSVETFQDPFAMSEIGIMEETGEGGRGPDHAAAREWYLRAAGRGHGFAWAKLGTFAMNGTGEPADAAKAVEHYERAAAAGNPWGIYLLADAFAKGLGVAVDRERSLRLMRQAATAGWLDAQTDLGYYLMGAEGFTAETVEGMRWTQRAAEAKAPLAMNNLGWYLHTGRVGRSDTARAVVLWREAAALRNTLAMWNLHLVFSAGNGVPADSAEAERWLQEAAAAGNAAAQDRIARRSADGAPSASGP